MAHVDEYYALLRVGELCAPFDCGCKMEIPLEGQGEVCFYICLMHESAQAMLDGLEALLADGLTPELRPQLQDIVNNAKGHH